MRRARVFCTGDDVQLLKSGQVVPFVRCSPDFQILTGVNYSQRKALVANVWAKFETQDMLGIDVISWVERANRETASAFSCVVSLYSVSKNSSWDEVLLLQKQATKTPSNKWSVTFTKEEIGDDLCCADTTFKVTAEFLRLGKTFTKSIFVNHMGAAEALCSIQNRLQFIETSGG